MTDKAFIDTNIWVYAHLQQTNEYRCNQALTLLESLPMLISSTQVLHEYYSVMLKYKIADTIIQKNLEVIISASEITLITLSTIRLAHRIRLQQGFSYWDSLILASAISANCKILYSEDLQHQQHVEGLIIINPFVNRLNL